MLNMIIVIEFSHNSLHFLRETLEEKTISTLSYVNVRWTLHFALKVPMSDARHSDKGMDVGHLILI